MITKCRWSIRSNVSASVPACSAAQPSADSLDGGAPEQSMLVLTCWNRQHNGYPPGTAVELFR